MRSGPTSLLRNEFPKMLQMYANAYKYGLTGKTARREPHGPAVHLSTPDKCMSISSTNHIITFISLDVKSIALLQFYDTFCLKIDFFYSHIGGSQIADLGTKSTQKARKSQNNDQNSIHLLHSDTIFRFLGSICIGKCEIRKSSLRGRKIFY